MSVAFGTRFHVVSTPSNNPFVIGGPASNLKYSLRSPRRGGLPTPWLLCMLKLAAAISVNDLPSSGANPPASKMLGQLDRKVGSDFGKKMATCSKPIGSPATVLPMQAAHETASDPLRP